MEEAEESISLLPNASVLLLLSLGALLTLLLLSYLLWPSTCPLDGCSGMLLMRPSPWASAPAPADSLRDRILLSLGKEEGQTPPSGWRCFCQLRFTSWPGHNMSLVAMVLSLWCTGELCLKQLFHILFHYSL